MKTGPKKKRPGPSRQAGLQEHGAVVKHGKGLIRAALVYPNTYRAGMSSLGFQTVYRLANEIEFLACERVFLPDTWKSQGQGRHSPVKSLETGLPLNQFDIILFSISFENDFFHLAQILGETGIPLRSSDRNHIHPLVAAGGVACLLNPEPIAPFIDLFLLGEAECLLTPFFDLFKEDRDKASLLEKVETRMKGAYVPALHEPVLYKDNDEADQKFSKKIEVPYQENLEGTQTHTSVLTSDTAFKNIFLMETLKGCPHGCRFCTAGFALRPPRIYPKSDLLQVMGKARGKTDKIGLVSSAVLDHPDIGDICRYGEENGFTLSFSSLRADRLDQGIIERLARSGVKTATIAPEAGSERMRRIINKKITAKEILDAARKLVEHQILNLRLYFMIGLPFETDEDVEAIVDLALEIKSVFLEASRKNKRIGTITLSVNPFIPKPCTPFQWAAMTPQKTLKRRANILQNGLKRTPNLTLQIESLKNSRINALLSLGDRQTADIIESALEAGWTRAMKSQREYCDVVIEKEKPVSAPLPWDRLTHHVSRKFLAREFQQAKIKKQSASCPMKDCMECGICIDS
ncbi:radical SAM protein [Desulfospira joergensenii]|uniref:radical SAM protein n=1 Tax=Desulfospira joergensenii TaxID=53329 RepID=UPI0003B72A5D|nr:radical SAM protein [Desulfospira joergensenii]